MASIRRGFSDDFSLDKKSVGAGITSGQEALDVQGSIKGKDLKVTGISSQTGYEGFLRADHQIAEDTTLSFDQGPVSSLSGEIIVETGKTVTVNEVVKETAGVGNNDNLIWKNIAGNHGDGKLSSGLVSNWDGKAFHFDNNDHVELPTSLGYTTKVSAFAWFKHGGSPAGNYHIIFGGQALEISVPVAGQLRTGLLADQRYVENYGSTGQLTDGSWHYIGFTYDGTTKTSYIDGVSVGTQTVSGTLDHTFDNRTIGRFGNSTQYYLNGYLSAAQIYDRDITASEILSNYNLGPYYKEAAVTNGLVLHLNANNPSSYPGTVRAVDTTDTTIAGGSQIGSLKVFNTFTPPSGGINERPSKPKPGQLYYNYDFKTIEFHDGYGWRQVDNTTRSGRAVFFGGYLGTTGTTQTKSMDLITIPTLGNSVYFGDLGTVRNDTQGCSDGTRGLSAGGYSSAAGGRITDTEYITLASAGNSIQFGDLDEERNGLGGCSSSTRGLFAGGVTNATGVPSTSRIDYFQISTLGTALEFGQLTSSRTVSGGLPSSTRAVWGGGSTRDGGTVTAAITKMDYSTFASKGNATEFGDDILPRQTGNGCSSGTRGVFAGGYASPNFYTSPASREMARKMSFVTIASTGNAIEFGELSAIRTYVGSNSTKTRGIWTGGSNYPAHYDDIEYIEFSSLGNTLDFGNLHSSKGYMTGSASDSHGGLGGF